MTPPSKGAEQICLRGPHPSFLPTKSASKDDSTIFQVRKLRPTCRQMGPGSGLSEWLLLLPGAFLPGLVRQGAQSHHGWGSWKCFAYACFPEPPSPAASWGPGPASPDESPPLSCENSSSKGRAQGWLGCGLAGGCIIRALVRD